MNKKYLLDLEKRGVKIVPTEVVERGSRRSLSDIIPSRDWKDFVVKPAVSAAADGTWLVKGGDLAAADVRFADQLTREDLLIQPYLTQIEADGEWSMIYFDGEFSHSVVKRPAEGDFRVQEQFGGSVTPVLPSDAFIASGKRILEAVSDPLLYAGMDGVEHTMPILYARIDGVEHNGEFMLMELEINEPLLFLLTSTGAAERFAEGILRRMSSTPASLPEKQT